MPLSGLFFSRGLPNHMGRNRLKNKDRLLHNRRYVYERKMPLRDLSFSVRGKQLDPPPKGRCVFQAPEIFSTPRPIQPYEY